MPKPCSWLIDYSDWLVETPFAQSDKSSVLWCKYCSKAVKRKKYNAEKHAATVRHQKRIQEKEHQLTKRESSDNVLSILNDPINIAEKIIEMNPSDNTNFCTKRQKKQLTVSYDFQTISSASIDEDHHEIDAFARSVAAQMKTLPEKYIISLTYEIQNLVTQKRLQALEDRNAERQAGLESPQMITVSIPPHAPSQTVQSSSSYTYQ